MRPIGLICIENQQEGRPMKKMTGTAARIALALMAASGAWGQSALPPGYSIATPRPINPAGGTTTPSAEATQRQNPYLGSVPAKSQSGGIALSLQSAIERGLRYNLGLVETRQSSADVRAERLRALSALLPQVSAEARQAWENLSFKEIGIKLPPLPGLPSLPATSGAFGFEDARVSLTQSIYNAGLWNQYRSRRSAERASALSIQDSRDVVVLVVGTAYFQALASAARVDAAKAQLASAEELDRQTADRVRSEVSPEIDSIRAQVERETAGQRVINAANALEKDKLTLARVIGLQSDQEFVLADRLGYRPLARTTREAATAEALGSRADLRAAEASVEAATLNLRAQKGQRLPAVSLTADYGGGGVNMANFNQVYTLAGNVSVPIYTGGRIRADVEQAQAEVARRRAEYEDLKGRVAYDVRVAWLDVGASDSSVHVAQRNTSLAERALAQSRDRYANGVTNYLEVVQAEEALAAARENYIDSLFSYDVAKISLARAMGSAETKLADFSGGK
jgi:outer membrane protein TolC